MIKNQVYYTTILTLLLCNSVNSEFIQYFQNIGAYFGYGKQAKESEDFLSQKVPYEVSVADEKFISEASKLTGLALSELDSCQHRVVLKLQTSCDKMNDEQLAKMAVMLLNCQSVVEGRKLYPCTDTMSLKDCTSGMDPVAWNSYHLMSNRARAVCYSVRQIQFRGLTEHTVNKLMDAARTQLINLDKISKDQENLHDMAEFTLSSITEGQKSLAQQQSDLRKAQLHGQLELESNIRRLQDEKELIAATHDELTKITFQIQDKLKETVVQMQKQIEENRFNHKEVLDDLIAIQNQAQIIFQKIDDSTKLLGKQSEITKLQYKVTATQLAQVNETVHTLLHVMENTKKILDERLSWLSSALGGTDLAVERLYLILWHSSFLLLSMLTCAFLSAPNSTRFIVTTIPLLNVAVALQDTSKALEPLNLFVVVVGLIIIQTVLFLVMAFRPVKMVQAALPWVKEKLTPQKNASSSNGGVSSPSYFSSSNRSESVTPVQTRINSDSHQYTSASREKNFGTRDEEDEEMDSFDFASPTPPLSRSGRYNSRSRSHTPLNLNGSLRSTCGAMTRMNTPCKLSTLPGRDRCYRHQSGDSIFAG